MSLFRNEKIATPQIIGYKDGSVATSGHVGEVISSSVAVGSAVALTTATPANVTTISLSAGDWDVSGQVNYTGTGATTALGGLFVAGINTTSATVPTDGSEAQLALPAYTTAAFKAGRDVTKKVINVSAGATTVYLVAEGTFSAGTVGAYGTIVARRVR